MNQAKKNLIWVSLFTISMAFVESAVVIYLRALYYPLGFDFPLQIISGSVATTEIIREAATLIMLVCIAFLAGRRPLERFAYFIYSFAIWDIFYYVFLKVILGWPGSWFTWDVLFLIPCIWAGPVIAPILNSMTMVFLAFLIIYYYNTTGKAFFGRWVWLLLITGSCITVAVYMEDYIAFLLQGFSFGELFSNEKAHELALHSSKYIPMDFNWYGFALGQFLFALAVIIVIRRNRKLSS